MRRVVFLGLLVLGVALGCGGVGGIQGPLVDERGNAMWQDSSGHQTIWEAGTGNAWFGYGGRILYGMDPAGRFYEVTAQGAVRPIQGSPPGLEAWPGALGPLPGLEQVAASRGLGMTDPGGYAGSWDGGGSTNAETFRILSDIQQQQDETTMAVINDMVGPTVDYYEDGAYVGSW